MDINGREDGMNYEFIAVPKGVNYKIGLDGAAVLATLL